MRECKELVKELSKKRLNPTKLAMLLYLSMSGWAKLSEISSALGIAKSTAWKHLKDIQEQGLVKVRYTLESHPQMMVAITEKGLALLKEYIEMMDKIKECMRREEKGQTEKGSTGLESGKSKDRP